MASDFRYGRRQQRPKFCAFCVDKDMTMNYKEPESVRRYVSDRGKIRPRRQTGICAKHQRQLAQTIKRARHLALLSFTGED